MHDTLTVNDAEYAVIKLLGKGKGGYSYLVTDGEREYVLKQIHHELCEYYTSPCRGCWRWTRRRSAF